MKKIISYILTAFILISSFVVIISCEEIIEIDLNDSDPQIVIEGVVTDQSGPYFIYISQTTDYYNPGDYPTISGAVVTISDDAGNFETLTETGPGIYQTDSLQGYPNKTYFLSVEVDGEIYKASSTMPDVMEIDSLYTKHEEGRIGGKGKYDLICVFQDKPDKEDFCRLKVYKNEEMESGYSLYNGRLSDGSLVRFDRLHIKEIEPEDLIRVDLFSIDQEVYEYYSTLKEVIARDPHGMGSTEVPANPNSNLSGDAIGYFGAFTVRSDSIIIE